MLSAPRGSAKRCAEALGEHAMTDASPTNASDGDTLPESNDGEQSTKSSRTGKAIVHLSYAAPDVDTLDLYNIKFEHVPPERCARETGGAHAPETRARGVTRLVGAYIPAVDGPGYMRSGAYECIALVAPSSLHKEGVVVGGCVFKPHSHPVRHGTCRFIELALFAVENRCQGRKLGRRLMQFLKRHAFDTYQSEAILTFADYKAFSFFKRVGYDRKIRTPATVWKPNCVHYNGAAVCETSLKNLDEEERLAREPQVPRAPVQQRVIPCTSGQPNCYCRTGRTRAIAKYDPATGNELQVYCSASDASRKLGLAPCSVTHVTNGLAESAGGHFFRYVNEVTWLNSGSRPVVELRRDGEVKAEHKSCNAAARKLFGKNTRLNGTIGEVCNGYLDHVEGIVFRWAEPRIHPCDYCGTDADADSLLLCDGIDGRCSATAHVSCLDLAVNPEGDWFCDSCLERKKASWSMAAPVARTLPRGYYKDRRGITPKPVLLAQARDAQKALDAARPRPPPPPPPKLVVHGPRKRTSTKRLKENADAVPQRPSQKKRAGTPKRRRPTYIKAEHEDAFVEPGSLCDLCARSDGRMVTCASCLGPRAHVACLPAPVEGPWQCGVCTGDAPKDAACDSKVPPPPPPKPLTQAAWRPPADVTQTINSSVCRACKREFRSPHARAAHLGHATACRAALGLPPLPPSQYACRRQPEAPLPVAAAGNSSEDDGPLVQDRGTRTLPLKPKRPAAVVSFEEASPKRRATCDSTESPTLVTFAATGGLMTARPIPSPEAAPPDPWALGPAPPPPLASPAPARPPWANLTEADPAPSIAEIRAAYQSEQAPPPPVAPMALSPATQSLVSFAAAGAPPPPPFEATWPAAAPPAFPGWVAAPVAPPSPATQSLLSYAGGAPAGRVPAAVLPAAPAAFPGWTAPPPAPPARPPAPPPWANASAVPASPPPPRPVQAPAPPSRAPVPAPKTSVHAWRLDDEDELSAAPAVQAPAAAAPPPKAASLQRVLPSAASPPKAAPRPRAPAPAVRAPAAAPAPRPRASPPASSRPSRARMPTDRWAPEIPAEAAAPAAAPRRKSPPAARAKPRSPPKPAAAPKKAAPRRSPPAARKPAAAMPRSPPKPSKKGAPVSPRPQDLPNSSLKYQQLNPKKKDSKSWHRYEAYKKATTVDEYFRLQGTKGDLKYDFSRGFLTGPPALARWCRSK